MAGVPVVFLPSPLLGPAVWEPVADVFEHRGWSTTVANVVAGISSATDVQDMFDETLRDVEEPVLVAHSNAGLFVPWLAGRHRIVASVFVDAGFPLGPGPVALSPSLFYDSLRDKADESGLLPPWTEWWGSSDFHSLVPDSRLRSAVSREAQRLPLSYFRGAVPVPDGWDELPCGYLAFGDTYAEERQVAVERGWPVRTIPGRHLHMLVDPQAVSATIVELLELLGVQDKPR